jgi:hypothetical protein
MNDNNNINNNINKNKVTIVTAFFDINRETNGDGRKITDYLEWIKKTLQLNCNLYIVTERKFVDFMKENRPSHYNTYIKEDTLENASYYKYLPRMTEILNSEEYKKRVAYPKRVECTLPEYNVIQYSKFGWLETAIYENPFESEYFFWMDAGISRFFNNMNLQNPYPNNISFSNIFKENENTFIVQQREDLYQYHVDEHFIWKADNLFKGGMFGGNKTQVMKVATELEKVFVEKMLNKNNVNNEQLSLVLLWKEQPTLFKVIPDFNKHPCAILNILS